jgi:hypothetical protein
MKNKRTLPFFLFLAVITACSIKVDPVITTDISKSRNTFLSEKEITGFNTEYSFTTKVLTQAYLKRKLDKLLTPPVKGALLVKEIAYAKFKHPQLFCTIIQENQDMLIPINTATEVSARKEIDIPFKEFIDGCIPAPFIGEFRVNTFTTFNQHNPEVAMDSTGDFVVTWTNHDDEGYGIYAKRYDTSGLVQGSEFQVNTYTSGNQTGSSVAMDSAGDFVIAWQSQNQDGNDYGIFAQKYHNTGQPFGSEFLVNTYTAGVQLSPLTAMDSAGDFVIGWYSVFEDGSSGGIYAQRFNSDGSLNGTQFLVNTTTEDNQTSPSVAMDSAGDIVFTWLSNEDGDGYGVYAQRYNSDGSKPAVNGSQFLVNTITEGNQTNPSLAMDTTGDFVITWTNQTNSRIYAQMYNSNGGASGSEFQVNTYTTGGQGGSKAVMDSAGDFVITWTSYGQDRSRQGVYAQRYNSDGSIPAINGSEFRVNSYITNNQDSQAVAADNAGDFIVTWNSRYQDGVGTIGIYAQRYNSNGFPLQ